MKFVTTLIAIVMTGSTVIAQTKTDPLGGKVFLGPRELVQIFQPTITTGIVNNNSYLNYSEELDSTGSAACALIGKTFLKAIPGEATSDYYKTTVANFDNQGILSITPMESGKTYPVIGTLVCK